MLQGLQLALRRRHAPLSILSMSPPAIRRIDVRAAIRCSLAGKASVPAPRDELLPAPFTTAHASRTMDFDDDVSDLPGETPAPAEDLAAEDDSAANPRAERDHDGVGQSLRRAEGGFARRSAHPVVVDDEVVGFQPTRSRPSRPDSSSCIRAPSTAGKFGVSWMTPSKSMRPGTPTPTPAMSPPLMPHSSMSVTTACASESSSASGAFGDGCRVSATIAPESSTASPRIFVPPTSSPIARAIGRGRYQRVGNADANAASDTPPAVEAVAEP